VHPKFYQSPFLSRRNDQMSPRAMALRNQFSQDSFDDPTMFPSTSAHVSLADDLVKNALAHLSSSGRKQMDDLVESFIKVCTYLFVVQNNCYCACFVCVDQPEGDTKLLSVLIDHFPFFGEQLVVGRQSSRMFNL
jgi:hypothetical protein